MANLPESGVLKADLREGWLTLTMDDPARRNALSTEMAEALHRILDAVRDGRSVRGITLQGSGGAFCAGGDLKGMARHIMSGDRSAIETMSADAGELFAKLATQPQPVIALVDGPALAGGLGLVCCADIVLVTDDARFALTEVHLGIPPAQIAPYVIARLGLATGKRLMLTGASFGGTRAAALGLADQSFETASAMNKEAQTIKHSILKGAPGAIAATKALALRAGHCSPADLQGEAARVFTDCLLSEEGSEGIASFVEKRQPKWAPHG